MVNEDDVAAAIKAAAQANQDRDSVESMEERITDGGGGKADTESDDCVRSSRSDSVFEGLLLTSCAARGPADYVRFMTRFQVSVLLTLMAHASSLFFCCSFFVCSFFLFKFFIFLKQKACSLKSIPVIRTYPNETPNKKVRFFCFDFFIICLRATRVSVLCVRYST